MIAKLIRTLTNRETSRRDRTAPRRALKPTLDGLEARVALNGGWTADPDRAKQALDSVERLLNTKHGIKLSAPGYNGYDPAKGGVTTYPPGAKENGGIFLHANPWVMIAETLLGRCLRSIDELDAWELL